MRKAYVGVALALALSACASTPLTRHFSLQSEAALEPLGSTSTKAVLVQAINVPTQFDRRNIILTQSDGQEVQVLNDYQWASPLADELHQALSAGLSQRLGVPSAEISRSEDGLPYWRIDVEVQRFDSVFEQYVRQDLSWRLSPNNFDAKTVLCRISLRADAGMGVEGLVKAHQQLQAEFVDVLSQQMQGDASVPSKTIDTLSCVS